MFIEITAASIRGLENRSRLAGWFMLVWAKQAAPPVYANQCSNSVLDMLLHGVMGYQATSTQMQIVFI
ncbi:hypothetical protein ACX1NX_06120 [Acinetobacter sp. ANC 5383]